MFLNVMSNVSPEKPYEESSIQALRKLLLDQLSDITLLCTIANYLDGFKTVGLDESDFNKYAKKIATIENSQADRFMKIDEFINEDIFAIKKGKMTDRTVITNGKEVRKLEAGLRTLKLFCNDILKMLKPNSELLNRVDERLYYFNHRSATLEVEIKELQQKMSRL